MMLSSSLIKETISSLKSRISKVFMIQKLLTDKELIALEGTMEILDKIIIQGRNSSKEIDEKLKVSLKKYFKLIEGSKKDYICRYIIPLMWDIINGEWSK